MYSANLRPIKDLIGQSMLQVAEARGNTGVLKLRHVDHHFRICFARSRCEDCGRFQEAIVDRISEISPCDILHRLADQIEIQ